MSGLIVLAGGTAVVAVAGGGHSILSSGALGILALALAHSLQDELQRQATRRSPGGWMVHDTVNTLLLSCAAVVALVLTALDVLPVAIRLVTGILAIGYAAAGCRFWMLRRRTLSTGRPDTPTPVVTAERPTGLP